MWIYLTAYYFHNKSFIIDIQLGYLYRPSKILKFSNGSQGGASHRDWLLQRVAFLVGFDSQDDLSEPDKNENTDIDSNASDIKQSRTESQLISEIVTPEERSHRRCSARKGLLRKFSKFTGKHLSQSFFFNKVASLRPATLLKKRLWKRCFTANFAKFVRTPFLTNTSGRLLLRRIIFIQKLNNSYKSKNRKKKNIMTLKKNRKLKKKQFSNRKEISESRIFP